MEEAAHRLLAAAAAVVAGIAVARHGLHHERHRTGVDDDISFLRSHLGGIGMALSQRASRGDVGAHFGAVAELCRHVHRCGIMIDMNHYEIT